MISITKEEKDAIRQAYPRVHIVRTMKQKSKRHRYYCEEESAVMAFLRRMRAENVTECFGGRGCHTGRKNAKRVAV